MNRFAMPLNSHLALLPDSWELLEIFRETCTISQVEFQLLGYTARRAHDQLTVSGSSCSWLNEIVDTAWFELLERISLVTARSLPVDTRWCLRNFKSFTTHRIASSQEIFPTSLAPEFWTPAKSNGVAIGQSWQSATQHALFETIERHLVLASWYGAVRPELLRLPVPEQLLSLQDEYRIEHYAMGSFACESCKVHATTTFLWPLNEAKPVIYGFGAGRSPVESAEKSLKEALQRLCFLYDAEHNDAEINFRPTPDFHQDYFLQTSQKDVLRNWLAGGHYEERYTMAVPFSGNAYWLDLTPHDLFPGKVVQVFIPGSLPLMFGRYQPPEFSDLGPERLIHPIM